MLAEFIYLQRYFRLQYVDDRNRATIFNTADFYKYGKRIIADSFSVRTYYGLIRPGYKYIYALITDELATQNQNKILLNSVGLGAFISIGIIWIFAVWLPYIRSKKKEVRRKCL